MDAQDFFERFEIADKMLAKMRPSLGKVMVLKSLFQTRGESFTHNTTIATQMSLILACNG